MAEGANLFAKAKKETSSRFIKGLTVKLPEEDEIEYRNLSNDEITALGGTSQLRLLAKTPAVIVEADVISSEFLNGKFDNKSIKLINIENNHQN